MKTKIFIIIIAVLISIPTTLYIYNNENIETVGDAMINNIDLNKQDNITNLVYNTCSNYETLKDKMLCSLSYTQENYKSNNDGLVYTSDDLFKTGGDCKSYTLYYITLADMFNYQYAYINTGSHVFAIVYNEDYYCILDQNLGDCVNLN